MVILHAAVSSPGALLELPTAQGVQVKVISPLALEYSELVHSCALTTFAVTCAKKAPTKKRFMEINLHIK